MKLIILVICTLLSLTTLAQANSQLGVPMDVKAQKIEKVFKGLSATTMELVYEFYDKDAYFTDPVGEHKGVGDIKKYYENLYKNAEEVTFDFSSHVCQKNECVSVWTMGLKTKSLNGGKPFSVKGNSHIKFNDNNMVIYHRDYFDMGEFIYEKVPVLQNIIKFIKNRLKS